VFGAGAGGGGVAVFFCGEPIVPSSVVLGAAVTLDSRWLGLRAVGEMSLPSSCVNGFTFVVHNIAGSGAH
jgi:hypothetical protein